MIRRPPRSTHLPDTTLFRSRLVDLTAHALVAGIAHGPNRHAAPEAGRNRVLGLFIATKLYGDAVRDRKSTRLNSSHANISYAVFCLKKKTNERAKGRGSHAT